MKNRAFFFTFWVEYASAKGAFLFGNGMQALPALGAGFPMLTVDLSSGLKQKTFFCNDYKIDKGGKRAETFYRPACLPAYLLPTYRNGIFAWINLEMGLGRRGRVAFSLEAYLLYCIVLDWGVYRSAISYRTDLHSHIASLLIGVFFFFLFSPGLRFT